MKETDLERFIQEATNKAKSRDLDFKHKLAIGGKVYANIASFALLTPSVNDKKCNRRFHSEINRQHS